MSIYTYYNSKYEKWYYNIIQNAKNQNRSKGGNIYYESHHIIPKSLGGDDNEENKVLLTAREHFICHWLLYKFCEGNDKHKMAHAWFMMCNTKKKQRYIPSSRIYEAAKKAHSIVIGKLLSGKPRSNEVKKKISDKNKGKTKSPEHRRKLSESHKGKKLSEIHKENISKHRIGVPRTEATKIKISQAKIGVKQSESHRLKNSKAKKGEKNPQFEGYFITPWGKFSSGVEASNSAPFNSNPPLIRRWCKSNNNKIFKNPKFPEWAGKTPAQVGFSFEYIKKIH